eukprot:TRINITY_DN2373_c0_g2_i2.p1 TRINITY_DN2373_c0_g2~~TRINITY_DN2373_c0_g2_i2.p1  ORF type:complete len:677 (-),score=62.74 TRINITY_DN2373_c0_g2_i2:566-2596(-)
MHAVAALLKRSRSDAHDDETENDIRATPSLARVSNTRSEASSGYNGFGASSTLSVRSSFSSLTIRPVDTDASVSSKSSWLSRLRRGAKRTAASGEESLRRVASIGRFPMYVAKIADILEMTSVEPHQKLLLDGKVQEYKPGMKVLFVSHQWTSWEHPDKASTQFCVLQDVLRGFRSGTLQRMLCPFALIWKHSLSPLIKQEDLDSLAEEGYVWYDYFCIPQPSVCTEAKLEETHDNLCKAVESIPFYLEHCQNFCMLAPFLAHADSEDYLALPSYLDRGWCRAELAAWSLTGSVGTPSFLICAPGCCAESGIINWLLFPPARGEFSVEDDRMFVDALIARMLHVRMTEALDDRNLKSFRLLKALSGYYILDRAPRITDPQAWLESYAFESAHKWSGGWHAIHFAALEGNSDILRGLIAFAQVSPDKRTTKTNELLASHPGMTPCHICAFYLPTDLAIENLEVLRKLGAKLMKRDLVGHTVLHLACMQSKRQPLIQYLIDVGCQLEDKTVIGDTPLSLACQFGYLDAATCLVQNGARVQFSNLLGMSPLMLGAITGGGALLKLLIDAEADVNHKARPCTGAATRLMGKAMVMLRPHAFMCHLVEGGSGRTALMIACMGGNVAAVETLLQAGADPFAVNSNGEDALCLVKKYSRNTQLLQRLSRPSIKQWMQQQPVDV